MAAVAALLVAAAVAHVAARRLSAPMAPLMIVAGAAASAVHPMAEGSLETAIRLGVAVLLFLAGMELEPVRIRSQRTAALRVGSSQFVAVGAASFALSLGLGFAPTEAAYVALALTASSTVIGVRILRRRQQMFEPFGRVVVGSLLLQDLLVLLTVPFLAQLGPGMGASLRTAGALGLLGAGAVAVRRWVAPLLARAFHGEMQLLAALSVLFVFLGAGAALDLPLVVAAFLAGISLSRFPANAVLRPELAPVGDFFAALFFTALGGLVRVPSATEIWQATALAALVVVVTPPLVAAVAERSGLSSRSALDAGLLLAQASELSLVIGLVGMVQGHLDPGPFTVIVLATTATMLLTPFLTTGTVTARLLRLHPSRRVRVPREGPPGGHLLLVGAGSTGREVLNAGYLAGVPLAVLDQDPTVVHELEAAGVRAVRGEVDDPRALEAAGAAGARAVVVAVDRPADGELLLSTAGQRTDVIVRVFDDEEARWVRERGGVPVVTARETAADFLEWFDREGADLRSARRGP